MSQRQRNKIGRNALCPCGSGRKYKKCCRDGQPMHDVHADWMASFLEEHVRIKVHQMRGLFQLEYLRVYDEWSQDEIHNQQAEDTLKLQAFVEIADTHAGSIASRYRIRLLLQ